MIYFTYAKVSQYQCHFLRCLFQFFYVRSQQKLGNTGSVKLYTRCQLTTIMIRGFHELDINYETIEILKLVGSEVHGYCCEINL